MHLASPASKHDSAKSAACWSTTRPVTGREAPKASVFPTAASQSTTAGCPAGSSPNAAQASSDHVVLSRSSSSVREAVAASVTKAPVRRWFSQASTVVTTPSSPPSRRSQAILGAAK